MGTINQKKEQRIYLKLLKSLTKISGQKMESIRWANNSFGHRSTYQKDEQALGYNQ